MARASMGTDETMVGLRLACGHICPRYWYVSDDAAWADPRGPLGDQKSGLLVTISGLIGCPERVNN